MKCKVCKKPLDQSLIQEEFEDLFTLANYAGMEALTEKAQALVEGELCSDCYYNRYI